MGFFKKIAKVFHPALNVISPDKKKVNYEPAKTAAAKAAREAELADAMKEFEGISPTLKASYMDTAKKAGTYGATPEFEAGLNSEVESGARGARVTSANRINAIKKALGHTDVFNPEGLGQTSANQTEDELRNAPAPAAETALPQAIASPDPVTAAGPTSVQDAPQKRTLSGNKGGGGAASSATLQGLKDQLLSKRRTSGPTSIKTSPYQG